MNKWQSRRSQVFLVFTLITLCISPASASPHDNGWVNANKNQPASRYPWSSPNSPQNGGYYPPRSDYRENFRREVLELASLSRSFERRLGNAFKGYGASRRLRESVEEFTEETVRLRNEVSRGLYGNSSIDRQLDRLSRYADHVEDRLRHEGRPAWRASEDWELIRRQLNEVLIAFRQSCSPNDPYGFGGGPYGSSGGHNGHGPAYFPPGGFPANNWGHGTGYGTGYGSQAYPYKR